MLAFMPENKSPVELDAASGTDLHVLVPVGTEPEAPEIDAGMMARMTAAARVVVDGWPELSHETREALALILSGRCHEEHRDHSAACSVRARAAITADTGERHETPKTPARATSTRLSA